jgi:hypothetical protein
MGNKEEVVIQKPQKTAKVIEIIRKNKVKQVYL